MTDHLPNDADGDALRRLAATGSDLTKTMEIDFTVDISNEASALKFAEAVEPLGFRTTIDQDDETKKWTCYCSRTMIPTYDAIVEAQQTLERIGRDYGATPEGWGSFGNASD